MIFLVLQKLRILFSKLQKNTFLKRFCLRNFVWYLNMMDFKKNWRVIRAFLFLLMKNGEEFP